MVANKLHSVEPDIDSPLTGGAERVELSFVVLTSFIQGEGLFGV